MRRPLTLKPVFTCSISSIRRGVQSLGFLWFRISGFEGFLRGLMGFDPTVHSTLVQGSRFLKGLGGCESSF